MQLTDTSKKHQKTIPQNIPTVEPFPHEGRVRAKAAAKHLGISLSGYWLYVKQGRIIQPVRYGPKTSVWDAAYIRDLAMNGIPQAAEVSE